MSRRHLAVSINRGCGGRSVRGRQKLQIRRCRTRWLRRAPDWIVASATSESMISQKMGANGVSEFLPPLAADRVCQSTMQRGRR